MYTIDALACLLRARIDLSARPPTCPSSTLECSPTPEVYTAYAKLRLIT